MQTIDSIASSKEDDDKDDDEDMGEGQVAHHNEQINSGLKVVKAP